MRHDVLRERMVETHIAARGIHDKNVLSAMRDVERHLFVPKMLRDCAYDDCPLPIGLNQTISQPYIVAYMTELLMLRGGENVLEIGTGSGYQAAVLCEIAKHVVSVERVHKHAERAKKTLHELGYDNIEIIEGDGRKGYDRGGPYDAIIVTAAADSVPSAFLGQLKEGGRMVIPLGGRFSQDLIRLTKTKEGVREERMCGVVFVPLV